MITNTTEQLQLANATVLPTGLLLNDQISFEQWATMADAFQTMQGGLLWWIGDWINFGESRYGDTYKDAIAATGYSYGTLANAAYVAKSVKLHARRENLSYALHCEIAGLSEAEQERWLDIAEQQELDRAELRASIKAGKVIRKADFAKPATLNLPIAQIHYRTWHNTVFNSRFNNWTVEELEQVRGYLQPWAIDYAAVVKRLQSLS